MAGFSAPRTGRLCLQEIFLLEAERFKSIKNPNGAIGNRTRVFLTYSAVPQATALPRTHTYRASSINMFHRLRRPKREANHRCPSVVEIINARNVRKVRLPGAMLGRSDNFANAVLRGKERNLSLFEPLYQLPGGQ